MSKTTVNVTILGLNRFSASLGMALREQSKQPKGNLNFIVTGQDDDHERMKAAKQIGAIDESSPRMRGAVKNANVVIVALPARKIENAYYDFGSDLKSGAVVLDMSINKTAVIELAKTHFPRNEQGVQYAYLVGIHPLVHNKFLYDVHQDVESANPQLFAKSDMIIAPDAGCPAEAIKLASDLAEILQMESRFLSPSEYDGLADFTENLPVWISLALFATLQNSAGQADLERTINPSFALLVNLLRNHKAEDLTALWQQSQQTTVHHLDELIESLSLIRNALARNDSDALAGVVKEILMAFQIWEDRRLINSWDKPTTAAVPKTNMLNNLLGLGALDRALQKMEKKDQDISSRRN